MRSIDPMVCLFCEQPPSIAYWRRKSEDMLYCTIRCECCGLKCEGAESATTFEARKFYRHMASEIATTKWNDFMASEANKAKKAEEDKRK